MDTPKRILQLPLRELRDRMKKRIVKGGRHPEAVAQELDKLLEAKKLRRAMNAKEKQLARLWKELMMPLKAELKNVTTMCAYEGGSAERREALNGYMLVLNTLHDRLTLESRKGFTPAQIGKAQFKPNNGSHWSDWVPASVKLRVQELFSAIPKGGVKVKIPFERKVPAALGVKLKTRLLERTIKELDVAKRKAALSELARDYEKNDVDVIRVANIEKAIVWITAAEPTEALPTTWSGFYK